MLTGLVVNYGYEKLLKLMEGNIAVAKEHLTTYFLTHDKEITHEQASYLANFAMQVLQTAGQIAVHQVASKRFNAVRKGGGSGEAKPKTRQGRIGKKGGVKPTKATPKDTQAAKAAEKTMKGTAVQSGNVQSIKIGRKLDYVFGKATGRVHNVQRSITMEKTLSSIGIFDNRIGRELVQEHLIATFRNSNNVKTVNTKGFVVKESLLMGPRGGVLIESIWNENEGELISVILKK
jgi:hypothetical protein